MTGRCSIHLFVNIAPGRGGFIFLARGSNMVAEAFLEKTDSLHQRQNDLGIFVIHVLPGHLECQSKFIVLT